MVWEGDAEGSDIVDVGTDSVSDSLPLSVGRENVSDCVSTLDGAVIVTVLVEVLVCAATAAAHRRHAVLRNQAFRCARVCIPFPSGFLESLQRGQ